MKVNFVFSEESMRIFEYKYFLVVLKVHNEKILVFSDHVFDYNNLVWQRKNNFGAKGFMQTSSLLHSFKNPKGLSQKFLTIKGFKLT